MAQRVMRMTQAFAIAMALHLAIGLAQTSCIPAITSLSPCLGFVAGNSSTTSPSSSCCSQLGSVVSSQAQCLCLFLNGGAARLGLGVNQTQALTLPGACNITTPPMSQCNAVAHAPAASPAISPVGAPAAAAAPSTPSSAVSGNQSPATPAPSSVPHVPAAGGGAKTAPPPTTSHNTNNGSVKKSTRKLMALLAIAACVSTLNVF